MSATLTISIVGGFQRGKSSLVNALVGRDVAEMGRGLSTTHENRLYSLSPTVSIIDTPGFDANGEDDGTAASAIDTANVVVYVHESKSLGETCADVFKRVCEQGKQMVFLLNCCNSEKWSPDENADIVATIEGELETKGMLPSVIPVAGKAVFPVNVLWARFGLDMMDPENAAEAKAIRKIRMAAEDVLGTEIESMPVDTLRAEMLRRSGFLPIRDFLRNLPLELLRHVAANSEREINRIVERFAVEFKKRWNVA